MGVFLAIAIGGAIGSLLRFYLSKFLQKKFGVEFPVGTLIVNLTGAFFIGFFFSYLVEKLDVSVELRAFLITGLLGGFTTFSTFSYESFNLIVNGEYLKFFVYFMGTSFVGLLLTFLGYNVGRWL
ncbi:MAG: fluoride efflux transporter CrcB [Thermocrinis sp.]|jgi:CrcB protein|uniref:fluoride efflux transporter CrcB n=1 Tax=Thermocrinis sp. TaxID=2024383 RepID=UPI003C07F4BB